MTKRKIRKNIAVILSITMLLLLFLICCCENGAGAKYVRQIDVAELTLRVSSPDETVGNCYR